MTYKAQQTQLRKYYKYGTNPNVSIIGSPTIENGIIKSYSVSNYTQVDNMCNSTDNYDYIVKFRTNNINTLTVILSTYHFVSVEKNDGNITIYNSDGGTRTVLCPLVANTWYWVKTHIDGTTKTVYYSTDGINYTLGATVTDVNVVASDTPLRFGVGVGENYGTGDAWVSEQLFDGEIDLRECFIKKGDTILWSGTKVEESTESPLFYNYNVDEYGVVNFNKGIVSSFSRSNYLKLPFGFAPGSNNWEVVFKVKSGSSTHDNSIIGNYGNTYQNGLEISFDENGHFQLAMPKDGTNTPLFSNQHGTYTILANTIYYIKVQFTGTKYILSYSVNNDSNYIQDISVDCSDIIYQAPEGFTIGNNFWDSSHDYGFLGDIYLKDSYIKVGNNIIWQGTTTTSDYDYYNDFDVYKTYKESIRTYYKRFTYTSDSTFTVPSGITNLKIDCVGAKGYTATSGSYTGNGGNGGRVQCNLAVSTGQTYYLTVGTVPSSTSQTYNASDIRFGGNTLNDRIIVAGGGGSGVYRQDPRGATKGTADGGAGGGLVGGNGGNTGADRVGQGGTQSDGGLGAYSGYAYHPFTAGQGEFGLGGTGNQNQGGIAGAGGAGWYGGGGAGCNGIFIKAGYSSNGAGGGGGSSYTNSSCTNVVHTQGYQNGTGYITIDYESTSSDYDYYVDVNTYKALKV